MAKKKAKKLTRDNVINLLCKISSEGTYYFFTGYTSPEGLEDYCPGIPDSFFQAAKGLELAGQRLEEEMEKLKAQFEIEDEEVEA